MKITAITCTYERPLALELCRKYMARQTRQPDQWLILDGPESMVEKLLAAIEGGKVEGDAVVFFEDDDYFPETWIEQCEKWLRRYDLVGEGMALYYNVAKRWWSQCENKQHASLCQTAITRRLFEPLCELIRSHDLCQWIDTQLWKIECRKFLLIPEENERLVFGIKAVPGKAGYSREHRKFDPRGAIRDPSMKKLWQLIGEDASNYAAFYKK